MPFGFYFPDKFIAVTTRQDLFSESVQGALKDNHGPAGFTCGCLAEEGEFPRLFTYKCANGKYVPKRPSEADLHHPLCVVRIVRRALEEDGTVEALPSAAIFFGGTAASGPALDLESDAGRERSTTYRAFIGNRIASGWVRAWRTHLTRHAVGDGIPSAGDLLRGVANAIDAARLRGGVTVGSILKPHSLRLGFGVIGKDAFLTGAASEIHGFLVDEFVRDEGEDHLQTRFIYAHTTLVEAARRSVRRFGNYTRPPFFFAAVLDTHHVVHRLAIMPVHFQGQSLVFVESGQERVTVAKKINAGECFHKPTSKAELTALAQLHPDLAWLSCKEEWPYRPDFVGLRPGDRCIEEQRGFKVGAKPSYDSHLDVKKRIFSAPPFAAHARYSEIDGTQLVGPETDIDWMCAGLRWLKFPPAIPVIG